MVLELQFKTEDPKALIILWEGQIWRIVPKSLFFKELKKFPGDIQWEDFFSRFSSLEENLAKRYAVYLLAKRNHLSSDLEGRLQKKGFSAAAAKAAALHCCQKGYLDDEKEAARLMAKAQKNGESAKAAYFKLKQKKGIKDSQLAELFQQSSSFDLHALRAWTEKNAKKINFEDSDELKKCIAKLYRRGFPVELIIQELKIFAAKQKNLVFEENVF